MLYDKLKIIYWIYAISGLYKPFFRKKLFLISKILLNICGFIHASGILLIAYYTVDFGNFNKSLFFNLEALSLLSDAFVNFTIVLISLTCSKEKYFIQLYENIELFLKEFGVSPEDIREFVLKIYLFVVLPVITIFISLLLFEYIFDGTGVQCFLYLPILLECMHVLLHFFIIISVLGSVNQKLHKRLSRTTFNSLIKNKKKCRWSILKFKVVFKDDNAGVYNVENTDIKRLCRAFYRLTECMRLLEKQHGVQIVLKWWSLLITSVLNITLLTTTESTPNGNWFFRMKCICFIIYLFIFAKYDDLIRHEVEKMEMKITSSIIDFHCDPPTRQSLQIFKQLVSKDIMRFKACNLFAYNYSTVLNLIVCVITYSIILVQLLFY